MIWKLSVTCSSCLPTKVIFLGSFSKTKVWKHKWSSDWTYRWRCFAKACRLVSSSTWTTAETALALQLNQTMIWCVPCFKMSLRWLATLNTSLTGLQSKRNWYKTNWRWKLNKNKKIMSKFWLVRKVFSKRHMLNHILSSRQDKCWRFRCRKSSSIKKNWKNRL